MANFIKELKDYQNAQLPTIPDSWKQITKQEAKDSLRLIRQW